MTWIYTTDDYRLPVQWLDAYEAEAALLIFGLNIAQVNFLPR